MAQISVDSLIGNSGPSYPEQIAAPYRKELTDNGFTQMLTPEDVDKALQRNDGKIQMVVLNSVCGCGARVARPGALLSLFSKVVPDERFTLFAGMEKDAVGYFRKNYLQASHQAHPIFICLKMVNWFSFYIVTRLKEVQQVILQMRSSINTMKFVQKKMMMHQLNH